MTLISNTTYIIHRKESLIMTKEHPRLTAAQKREQYKKKWDELNIRLGTGEFAVQIEEGGGKYFLTNRARIFSVAKWGTEWRERRQRTGESPNTKTKTGSIRQLTITLSLGDGEIFRARVSKLMAKYFPLEVFNPLNEETVHIHHKEQWKPELYTWNNREENLQIVGEKAHSVITMIQGATLGDNGLEFKNNSLVWKKIGEIAPDADHVNVLISKVDKKTKKVLSTEGAVMTCEEAADISFEGTAIQWNEEYWQRLLKEREEELEAMKLVEAGEATGKVRVVNGHLQLVKEKKGKK